MIQKNLLLNRLKIHKRWLWVAGVVGLVVVFTVGDTGFYKQITLLRRKKQLEKKITVEAYRQQVLQKQIDSLQNNPRYIEKFVREHHKMARDNEIIYLVE